MQTGKLSGKVALVTGASSGIGEATTLALATAGARVAIAARRVHRLNDLANRIRHCGGEALPIEADVTDEAQASAMVRRTLEAFGRLDMLLNIAGVGVAAPFQNTTTAEYRQMVEVNFLGLLYPIHAALPAMKLQGEGHIIIVSSGTGRYIHPSTVYSGTKHAASAMAESLRREVGKDWIRVTSLEPGAVKTDSGLIYREQRPGTGVSPKATDTVKVNYRGTLVNGTEFDSSYSRNQPAQFPLNGVIKCWTEGVQKMKVGGKSVLVCPSDLAYGDQGRPSIPGGAALIFEIELLEIVAKP